MISPELADHKAICYRSDWRGLRDSADGHPRHYVMLSYSELADLAHTGSFTLPDSIVPDSVRAYRESLQELQVPKAPTEPDMAGALAAAVYRARSQRGNGHLVSP